MAISAAAVASFALNAARWLNTPDAPEAADAIVVLAGRYERAIYAGELYRRGLAPVVYVSVPAPDPAEAPLAALGVRLPPKHEIYEQTLRALGTPEHAIRRFGRGSASTFEEADALRQLFTARGTRLLVITSPFHVRRARMILQDVLGGNGVAIRVVATPTEHFPDRWWTSQIAAREVLLEWAKIAYYLLGGRFRAQGS